MSPTREDVEVAVVGSGLVGQALAALLARSGLEVALVAPAAAPVCADPESWDSRIYAISPASRQLLEDLGAWSAQRTGPVARMQIHGDRAEGCLQLSAAQAGVPRLATIVEQSALAAGLDTCLAGLPVQRIEDHCTDLEMEADARILTLGSGRQVRARLVIGADGARSPLRERAGIAVRAQAYGQDAVVANFRCGRPHQGTAWQWFSAAGIVALLPLPGDRVSLVWSAPEALAAELSELSPEQLAQRVNEASQGAAGSLQLLTPPRRFPLHHLRASRLIAPRLALAGDAAHVVHPLAGQGVNLGLAGAAALARSLAERRPGADPGAWPLLRRYERAHAERVWAMGLVTDGLQRLFTPTDPLLARCRNAGLWLTERLAPAKKMLILQALG